MTTINPFACPLPPGSKAIIPNKDPAVIPELAEGLPGTPLLNALQLTQLGGVAEIDQKLTEAGFEQADRWVDPSDGGKVHLTYVLGDGDWRRTTGDYQLARVSLYPRDTELAEATLITSKDTPQGDIFQRTDLDRRPTARLQVVGGDVTYKFE